MNVYGTLSKSFCTFWGTHVGIHLSLERVSQSDLDIVCQLDDSQVASLYISMLTEMYFWPTGRAITREHTHLCIEKSYYGLLDTIVSTNVENDPAPTWQIIDGGEQIANYNWGGGPVRFFSPDQTRDFLTVLNAISGWLFYNRYMAAISEYVDDSDEEDWDELFLSMEACFQTTRQFITFAVDNQEALLCYTG